MRKIDRKMMQKFSGRKSAIALCAGAFLLFASPVAYADCTSPASSEGGLDYNFVTDKYNLCDGANWIELLTAGGSSTIWENVSDVVRLSSTGAYTNADFVFGSPSLDDDTDASHDSRIFFDKSKGAFRSGIVTGTEWDAASVGDYSTAMGGSTTASGLYSTSMGRSVTAGSGTAADGAGDGSFALGLIDDAVTITTNPKVTGIQSFGIFMDDQDGVVFASSNTLGLFGGRMIIDPNVPATNLVADVALDITGAVKVDYDATACSATIQGAIRYDSSGTALNYCDGTTWQTLATSGGGGASEITDLSDAFTDYTTDHNLIMGRASAAALTSGAQYNTFVGENAGAASGTSTSATDNNTALGYNALGALTIGKNNAAIGVNALNSLTSGEQNIAIGTNALITLATNSYNIGIGTNALYNNIGHSNTAIGIDAMNANSNGNSNVAVGRDALKNNVSGSNSVALGRYALFAATGGNNTAVGYGAGYNAGTNQTTTGTDNILIGVNVTANTGGAISNYLNIGDVITGDMSTTQIGIGVTAPATTLDVAGAVKVDYDATACAVGIQGAIRYDSSGNALNYCDGTTWQTIANGGSTGLWTEEANRIYYQSVSFYKPGATPSYSNGDTAFFWHPDKAAFRAGHAWWGWFNDANIGTDSVGFGYSKVAGAYSFAAGGTGAFPSDASGASSFAFGQNAIASGAYGSFASGYYVTASGSYSFARGRKAIALGDYSVAFGLGNPGGAYPQVSGASSFGIFMGDQSGTNITQANAMVLLGGKFGIGDTTPDTELDVVGDIEYTGTLTDVSDRRLKTDITLLDRAAMVERLMQVDTYSFRMKGDEKGQIEYGVMAQELENFFPELVRTANDEMGTKSVNYIGLIAPMIEATKDLKAENNLLRAELDDVRRDVAGLKAHTGYGTSKAEMGLLMLLGIMLGGLGALIITRRKT
ncbi:MAG: tail fiber domain-containing protein [Rhodospirillales bacterium]|nr:tail fiber domain-containing protein [Rhodospirillales bacterium]